MEEIKHQIVLLGILIILLGTGIIIYKTDLPEKVIRHLSLSIQTNDCIKINDKICLAEDKGLRVNYYEASTVCSKEGMTLPTRDEAWDIWINSENCHRVFASDTEVPKNKYAFIHNCQWDGCIVQTSSIKKYCSKNSYIKFPLSSQYENGSFWLKDNAGGGRHYAINYSSGKIRAYDDSIKTLGVRCIKK